MSRIFTIQILLYTSANIVENASTPEIRCICMPTNVLLKINRNVQTCRINDLNLFFSQRLEQDTSILVLKSIQKEDLELTFVNFVVKSLVTEAI